MMDHEDFVELSDKWSCVINKLTGKIILERLFTFAASDVVL